MSEKRNKEAGSGGTGAARRKPQGYSRGNANWNTESYHDSVKTNRTATRVINTGADGAKREPMYYDRTVSAEREEKFRRFEEMRSNWKETVKKNKRYHRSGRRFAAFVSIVLALAVVSAIVYKILFVANNIIIEGNSVYTADEIIKAAELDKSPNLFSFSSKVAGDEIRFFCPLVTNTTFDRRVPDKVLIKVEEKRPIYCAEIYGEWFGISEDLRIAGRISESEVPDYIRLKLQTVAFALSGGKIKLKSDRAQRFLEEVTDMLSSSQLKQRLNSIDLRNDFDISMTADNKYLLKFGTQENFDVKIKLAAKTLEDDMFNVGSKACINFEDISKTSIIVDNQLVIE